MFITIRFVELIEAIAANLSIPEGAKARQIIAPNLVIHSQMVDTSTSEGYQLSIKRSETTDDVFTEKRISSSCDTAKGFETSLKLDTGIFNATVSSKHKKVKVAAAFYENANFFQALTTVTGESSIDSEDVNGDDEIEIEELEETHDRNVTSRVVSSAVVGQKMENLKKPVELSFRLRGKSPVCVSWDFKANGEERRATFIVVL